MIKLKLMALGLMFLMIQSAVAVTLPSSSYTPFSNDNEPSGVVFGSGSTVGGSSSSLGLFGGYQGECDNQPTGNCEGCCTTYYDIEACLESGTPYEECRATYSSCIKACEGGGSLPLDGGLSILLVLALGTGAVRAIRKSNS